MSSSEIAETIASKIFEVYSPTPLGWRIGRKIMLRLGRSLADCRYIVTDVGRQCIYVLRIPGIILGLLGCSRQLARK